VSLLARELWPWPCSGNSIWRLWEKCLSFGLLILWLREIFSLLCPRWLLKWHLESQLLSKPISEMKKLENEEKKAIQLKRRGQREKKLAASNDTFSAEEESSVTYEETQRRSLLQKWRNEAKLSRKPSAGSLRRKLYAGENTKARIRLALRRKLLPSRNLSAETRKYRNSPLLLSLKWHQPAAAESSWSVPAGLPSWRRRKAGGICSHLQWLSPAQLASAMDGPAPWNEEKKKIRGEKTKKKWSYLWQASETIEMKINENEEWKSEMKWNEEKNDIEENTMKRRERENEMKISKWLWKHVMPKRNENHLREMTKCGSYWRRKALWREMWRNV